MINELKEEAGVSILQEAVREVDDMMAKKDLPITVVGFQSEHNVEIINKLKTLLEDVIGYAEKEHNLYISISMQLRVIDCGYCGRQDPQMVVHCFNKCMRGMQMKEAIDDRREYLSYKTGCAILGTLLDNGMKRNGRITNLCTIINLHSFEINVMKHYHMVKHSDFF